MTCPSRSCGCSRSCGTGGVRMTGLADYLGLEKSTMTGLVDRAEKRGLLERGPNACDGRAVDVFLSPGGLPWPSVSTPRSGGHCPR